MTEHLLGNSLPPAPPVQAGAAPSTSHCSQSPPAALPAPPPSKPSPRENPSAWSPGGRGERCAQELWTSEGDPLPILF